MRVRDNVNMREKKNRDHNESDPREKREVVCSVPSFGQPAL